MLNNTRKLQPFTLGRLLMTANIQSLIEESQLTNEFIFDSLKRHVHGDWGSLSEDDKLENENALKTGCRILSAYQCNEIKIWIITEADRSATTVLLPSDY